MKKLFIVPMLIGLAMICSCQKQGSTTEQQLAQRKVELDAREEALAERKSALDEREKALAQRESATADARTMTTGVQGHTPDPAQVKTETDTRIQQLPPEVRALVPDRSQIQAQQAKKNREKQDRSAQSQLGPEDLQRQWQLQQDKAKMSAGEFSAKAESAATDATSRSPSPTPQ